MDKKGPGFRWWHVLLILLALFLAGREISDLWKEWKGSSSDEFIRNFNTADEDFSGVFGYYPKTVVFVTTDGERLSCIIPEDQEDEYSEKFGLNIFKDVFQSGDTIEADVVATISSADAAEYSDCWKIPVKSEYYRSMVIGDDAVGREKELESATGGILYTVIRDLDSQRESSVPQVLKYDTSEYKGYKISVVRYQLSGIDTTPAFIFPTFSTYVAP